MSRPPRPTRPASHNLLPRDLQRSRQRRARVRLWTIASASYLSVLFVACAGVYLVMGPHAASAQAELKDLLDQENEFREAIGRIDPQLRALRHRLESRRVLAEQPDHSQLLTLVAACQGREMIFRQLQLLGSGQDPTGRTGNRPIAPGVGAEREPRHFELMIRGVSRTETGVSQLTDKLRALDVFDDVELLRTGRDMSGPTAVSFEISCAMREGPRAPAASSASREGPNQ